MTLLPGTETKSPTVVGRYRMEVTWLIRTQVSLLEKGAKNGRRGDVSASDLYAEPDASPQGPQVLDLRSTVFTVFPPVVHMPGKEGVNNQAEVGKSTL